MVSNQIHGGTSPQIDHVEYPKRMRQKTESELRYIIKDAGESARLMPDSPKSGYWLDEVNYAAMELKRRESLDADHREIEDWRREQGYTV